MRTICQQIRVLDFTKSILTNQMAVYFSLFPLTFYLAEIESNKPLCKYKPLPQLSPNYFSLSVKL